LLADVGDPLQIVLRRGGVGHEEYCTAVGKEIGARSVPRRAPERRKME
jgi:hypothetical protein